MKKVIPFLVLACVLGAAAWALVFLGRAPHVAVISPQRGKAVQAVFATGTVEASVMLPLAARNMARLSELHVDEGSDVKKDQLLAKLEDKDLQDGLNEAKAREAYALRVYQNYGALVTKGFVTRKAFDQAKADWEAAQATVARLATQADFMKLTAPADGTVIRRDGEIGQLIPANQPVFWLSCCAPLRIAAEVDEEDIPLVQPGQNVLIRADAFSGALFHGTVTSITPKGDAVARSYRVRIGFTDAQVPFKIGMTAETNIITAEKNDALLVPRSAVKDGALWVVRDGKLARQLVTTGIKAKDQIEILDGLRADDRVAIAPDVTWQDNMVVEPVTGPSAAPAYKP